LAQGTGALHVSGPASRLLGTTSMQLVLLAVGALGGFPAALPPGTPVSRRVEHVAEQVYDQALADFRLHAENRKLAAQAAALEARLAALRAPPGAPAPAAPAPGPAGNGTNATHALVSRSTRQPLQPALRATAQRVARAAAPQLAAIVKATVVTALDDAAAAAARIVLAHACDSAVSSAVFTAHQVVTETLGEGHADEIAEKVRVGVRNECLDESQVMAESAVTYAAGEVRTELPKIVQAAATAAAAASATEIALEYEANMTAADKAALANTSLGQPLNGSNASVFTTTPPPPVVNITPNATAVPNITNASAPEPSAATPEPLELAPPPWMPAVNVTIGNRTVEGNTTEPPAPTEPPPPPRVQQAMWNAVEMAKEAAAEQVQHLVPAKKAGWQQHFAEEMQRLALASTR